MSLVVDRAAAEQLNLTVLRRIDPDVEEVLATAGHVCLYHMTVATQQWARKNVEGSLFVLKRKSAPRFRMIVLNKISTDNYSETIHSEFELECNPPYLMYTHGNDEIHGIWFYENSDLEKIHAIVSKIVASLPKLPAMPPPAAPALPTNNQVAKQVAKADNFWDMEVQVKQDPPGRVLQAPPSEFGPAAVQHQQPVVAPAAPVPVPPQPVSAPAGLNGNLAAMLQLAHHRHVSAQVPTAASAPAAPAAPSPKEQAPAVLLTPSQLQQASTAPPAAPAPAPAAPMPTNPLQQLFAKAGAVHSRSITDVDSERVRQQLAQMKSASQVPSQPAPAPSQLPPPQVAAPPPAPPARPAAETRQALRQALVKLLNNDAVLDALVAEFRTVGLLQ